MPVAKLNFLCNGLVSDAGSWLLPAQPQPPPPHILWVRVAACGCVRLRAGACGCVWGTCVHRACVLCVWWGRCLRRGAFVRPAADVGGRRWTFGGHW